MPEFATAKLTPEEVDAEKRVAALNLIENTDWDSLTTPALVVIALTIEVAQRS